MSKKEIKALAEVLTDPVNEDRTPEEVAQLCRDALDDIRAQTHRIAAVGQIQPRPQEPTLTVALGPFSARGTSHQERFARAVSGGTAAREAGGGLAWDSKTGKGRGRFMLVPILKTPRDAWNFYRAAGPEQQEGEDIGDTLTDHIAHEVEPACTCGLSGTLTCRSCGAEAERRCHRHSKGAPVHTCAGATRGGDHAGGSQRGGRGRQTAA